jgi:hypothetical protein
MASGNRAAPKLIIAVVLGLMAGWLWASIELKKNPFAFLGSKKKDVPAPKPTPKPKPPEPPPIASVEKKPEPPKPAEKPPEPVKPPPPGISKMTPIEWEVTRASLERKLNRGRFDEFVNDLAKIDRKKVPDTGVLELRKYEDRFAYYQRLLAETSVGKVMPPPPLYLFTLVNGNEILAKLVTKDDKSYYIEMLIGIGTRLDKNRVKGMPVQLTPEQALARAEMFLEDKCENKGILRMKRDELIVGFADSPKRNPPPNAMAYFDMAEFCAENGLAELIPMLLDCAREKDANIVNNVHEIKAARQVDMLRFLDSIQAKEDAMEVFLSLNARYYDTAVFAKERLYLKEKFGTLVRETAPPPPAYQPVEEPPPAETPPPDQNPAGGDTIASGPKKTDPKEPAYDGRDLVKRGTPPKPAVDDKWQRPVTGAITVEAAQEHVAKGDAAYAEGKKHLQNSDPNENPNGWASENKSALKFMSQAFEAYDTAQVIYEKLGMRIPSELLEKARETNMIRSMCRKRAVTSR